MAYRHLECTSLRSPQRGLKQYLITDNFRHESRITSRALLPLYTSVGALRVCLGAYLTCHRIAGAETVGIIHTILRDIGSSNYGVAQSAVVLLTLILTMTLHPEVLRKVQEEIDAVVGAERLPELYDRKQLPYLDCVLLEVYRYDNALLDTTQY